MVSTCPYCPNCRPHCVRSRESQLSPGIPSQVYSEAGESFLKNPIALTFFERRYSHHLKPLDAWNSRQSHSMELVNTSHQSGRGLMCVGKQPLTSKLSLQRQVPQMYSRSMQQSTCSFPVHWCGFLSGPELSLTSPFDSASITPDSQKIRHFFEQSFDGVERDMTLTSHTLDHSAHVHSASGSPGYPHVRNLRLDRYMRGSQDGREQYLRSNLLCFQQTVERSRDRRVNSFELNLSGDRDRTTEPKRQSYLMLPNHYSSDSSRRGSALSNASIRSAREFAPRIDECDERSSRCDATEHQFNPDIQAGKARWTISDTNFSQSKKSPPRIGTACSPSAKLLARYWQQGNPTKWRRQSGWRGPLLRTETEG
ncbi:hypothetical protein FGIG_07904 [Fasciola gigantica]|uniref:Uncharacterized protein n=1 Tax=Fasciola gigantica TaxID=46835 RepID=A0A504Z181_FASGI|nr:hypothetical protein FGIG_07904 [Fasciola gigantica]